MTRRRLLVVIPVPEPAGEHIEGLRLALGDPSLGSIGPHITLVPPVNVREESLADAWALLRSLGDVAPITTAIGPVSTFAPTNPVLYLAVGESVTTRLLRDRIFVPPLSRPLSHEFVAHVTVNRRASEAQLEHARSVLHYSEVVTLDTVAILEEHVDETGRQWVDIADVVLGSSEIAGRGGLETRTIRSRCVVPDAVELAGEAEGDVVFTATRGDEIVGIIVAATDGSRLSVESLNVIEPERNTGVGRVLASRLGSHAAEEQLTLVIAPELPTEVSSFVRHVGLGATRR